MFIVHSLLYSIRVEILQPNILTMQKPKHNKRQHQMCRANMCPIFTRFAFFYHPLLSAFSLEKNQKETLDTFYMAIQFFPAKCSRRIKKWVSCHTQRVRSECERKNFHGKLNENKKVFYNFSIRLYRSGHINHAAAVVVTSSHSFMVHRNL